MKPISNLSIPNIKESAEKIKTAAKNILGRIPKEKRPILIAFVGIALMAFILFTDFSPPKKSEPESDSYNNIYTDFAAETEKKLCDIVSSIDGAGRCKVMVTIESGEENIYAENIKGEESEYVVIETNSDEGGLLLKVIRPKIRGVAIVCDGGDKFTVKNSIIETVCAALGIRSTRVSVTKMENPEGNQ